MQNIISVYRVKIFKYYENVMNKRTMIDNIKTRKLQWLGNTLIYTSHIQILLERIIPEKKGRG